MKQIHGDGKVKVKTPRKTLQEKEIGRLRLEFGKEEG